MNLTPKQREVLDYISEYRERKGFAPSQNEIAKHFGFKSLGTVQNYLVRLERAGAINKTWNGKRALSVVDETPTASPVVEIELAGRVAAGRPIEAVTAHEKIEVPPSLLRSGEHFALKVMGQSMIGDGILDGDFVIVRKQRTANNGQTVVALIDNEATVKRLNRKGERVQLLAANPEFPTIEVSSEHDFKIEGIVVGVIRKMP